MGTILASAIVTSARVTLLDPAPGKTWLDATMLLLINEALRQMALAKPEVYVVRGAVDLVPGYDQALPVGGTATFKFTQNVTSKKRCNQVSESLLIEETRFAPYPTEEVDVESWALDARDTTRFMVTPPNDGTGSLLGSYGGTPTVASLATVIPVDDIYESPIKYLLLSECYAADTTRKDMTKATYWSQKAMGLLGLETQTKAAVTPKLGQPGGQ